MKRMRKGILLTGILCAMGMAVCACSGTDTESANRAGAKAVPQETDRAALENDGKTEIYKPEAEMDTEKRLRRKPVQKAMGKA